MTPEKLTEVQAFFDMGLSPEKVAKKLGMHHTSLVRKLAEAGYRTEARWRLIPITPVPIAERELVAA